MASRALTDRFVASVTTKERENFFDTKARGLALRVTPSGAKTFYFVYRAQGKPQWLTLGSYPAVSLATARTLALDKRHGLDVDGRDPAAERRTEREAAKAPPAPTPSIYTFADLAKLYEKLAKQKKRTWEDDMRKVERCLLPAWGSQPLRSITRAHVHELLDSLVAQGMTVGVNRIQALISRLFTVALDRSLVDAHPAARMEKRFTEKPHDRVLSDDELRQLWKRLEGESGRAADAIKLRLLLGQRGAETIEMLWSEVDLDGKVWRLSAERAKNGKAHVVPLPATSLALLKRRRKEVAEDEARVFPGLTPWTPDFRALSPEGGAYEWKDLRRTVATRLAAMKFGEDTIGRVLNHARYTVTGRHYNQHPYIEEKRAALEAWDRELTSIVTGKTKKSRVVRFSRG